MRIQDGLWRGAIEVLRRHWAPQDKSFARATRFRIKKTGPGTSRGPLPLRRRVETRNQGTRTFATANVGCVLLTNSARMAAVDPLVKLGSPVPVIPSNAVEV
jgi:hypothetical protein